MGSPDESNFGLYRMAAARPIPRQALSIRPPKRLAVAGELRQIAKPEDLEEAGGRAVVERRTRQLGAAGDADEAPLDERAQHFAGRDAADALDVGAQHRLAVRDDRQRLERRGREPRRLDLPADARDERRELRARAELEAAGDLL